MTGDPRLMRILRDKTGVSAVEFALIAPVLGFLVVAGYDAVNFAGAFTSMQRAERSGIQYFMNGGTSMDVVKSIITTSWRNPPSNSTVNASEVCKCGATVTTCGSNGACLTTYTANMTVTASATVQGFLMSIPESKSETVRVQ